MTVKEMLETNMLICKLRVVHFMGSVILHEYIYGADEYEERLFANDDKYTLSTAPINYWEIDEHPTGWGVNIKLIPKEILNATVIGWKASRTIRQGWGEKYELFVDVEM